MKLAEFKNPFTGETHSVLDLRNLWLLIVGFAVWGVLRNFGDRFASELDRKVGMVPLGAYEEPEEEEDKRRRKVLA